MRKKILQSLGVLTMFAGVLTLNPILFLGCVPCPEYQAVDQSQFPTVAASLSSSVFTASNEEGMVEIEVTDVQVEGDVTASISWVQPSFATAACNEPPARHFVATAKVSAVWISASTAEPTRTLFTDLLVDGQFSVVANSKDEKNVPKGTISLSGEGAGAKFTMVYGTEEDVLYETTMSSTENPQNPAWNLVTSRETVIRVKI